MKSVNVLTVVAVVLLGLVGTTSAAIFSDNFEEFTGDPQDVIGGANTWAAYLSDVTITNPSSGDPAVYTPAGAARVYGVGDGMGGGGTSYSVAYFAAANRASAASIGSALSSGVVTLTYEYRFWGGDDMTGKSAVIFRDSITGNQIDVQVGWLKGAGLGANGSSGGAWAGWFADQGSGNDDRVRVTTTLDFTAGTFSSVAVALTGNGIFGGSTTSSSATLTLPANYAPDQVIVFTQGQAAVVDDLEIIPEPVTMLVLLAGAGLSLLRRRSA